MDGSWQVTAIARPMRTAFLVHPSDPTIALAAAESATLQWAGQSAFMIPCSPDGAPEPIWSRMIEKYDPDIFVDLVGVAESFTVSQQALDRVVHRWLSPLDTIHIEGAAVSASLRHWIRTRRPQIRYQVEHFTPLRGHPLMLPLACRFGHIVQRPLEAATSYLTGYWTWDHSRFAEIRANDPAGVPTTDLKRRLLEVPASLELQFLFTAGTPQIPTSTTSAISMTMQGIPGREPSMGFGESGQIISAEEHIRPILVLSAPDSVADFCLVWNLRAQRLYATVFPLWADPAWFSEPETIALIAQCISFEREDMVARHLKVNPLHILSASLAREELEAPLQHLQHPYTFHELTELPAFFTSRLEIGVTATSIAHFTDQVGRVPVPRYNQMADFEMLSRIECGIQIEGHHPPRGSSRDFHRMGNMSRLARDGISVPIDVPSTYPPETLLSVGTNNAWEILHGVSQRAGLSPAVSDKGQIAIAALRLLGSTGLSLVASSKVYGLLREMAEIIKRQAIQSWLNGRIPGGASEELMNELLRELQVGQVGGGQFERQHKTADGIRAILELNRHETAVVINWLAARQILLRGYELECPNCHLHRWYLVDRLISSHTCDGCLESMPLPVGAENLAWHYRLNETIAHAIDQGVIPHLLTLQYVSLPWMGPDAQLIGHLPGVLFTPRSNGHNPMEADVVQIRGRELVIGECKAAGSWLPAKDVQDYEWLAGRLGARSIVFATLTNFEGAADALELIGKSTHQIEVLTAEHLLDGGTTAAQYLRRWLPALT